MEELGDLKPLVDTEEGLARLGGVSQQHGKGGDPEFQSGGSLGPHECWTCCYFC